MNNSILKIYDPQDVPFGKLSLHYKDNLLIKGIKYGTCSKYIYSNLLKKIKNKQKILKSRDLLGIKTLYENLRLEEVKDEIRLAIFHVFQEKISQNNTMRDILIESGNSPIYYISPDSFLGIDVSGNFGENVIGKILEQLRQKLFLDDIKTKKIKEQESMSEQFYELYIVLNALQKKIRDEGDDLSKYINLNLKDIISDLQLENDYDKLEVFEEMNNPKFGMLIDIIKNNRNPVEIVHYIRKYNIGKLYDKKIEERNLNIVKLFIEKLIRDNPDYKNRNSNEYSQLTLRYLKELSDSQIQNRGNQIYELLLQEKLDSELSNKIHDMIKKLDIPSEENVKTIQEYNVVDMGLGVDTNSQETTPDFQTNQNLEPLRIYEELSVYEQYSENNLVRNELKLFSILDTSVLINIKLSKNVKISLPNNVYCFVEKLFFPSVIHYMYYILFLKFVYNNKQTVAYSKLTVNENIMCIKQPLNLENFKDAKTLANLYNKKKELFFKTQIKKFTKLALNIKFKNPQKKKLLKDTSSLKIIWNDPQDSILGIGSKGNIGENYVGNYMTEIRKKIKKVDAKKVDELDEYLKSNETLFLWIKKRVKDYCKIINYFNKYFRQTSVLTPKNLPPRINYELVSKILDNVLNICYPLKLVTTPIQINKSEWFKILINKEGQEFLYNINYEEKTKIINLLWERILVLILVFRNAEEKYNINTTFVLKQLTDFNNQNSDCKNFGLDDEFNNCVFAAITNLVKISLNIIPRGDNIIFKTFFEMIVSLILNTENVDFDNSKKFGQIYNDLGEKLLKEIKNDPRITNKDVLNNYLNFSINYIREYDIPQQIKLNRVNFFGSVYFYKIKKSVVSEQSVKLEKIRPGKMKRGVVPIE